MAGVAYGQEQAVALPIAGVVALLGVATIFMGAVKVVKRRSNLDWRLRQALDFITSGEEEVDLENPRTSSSTRITEVLRDSSVLIFDLEEYQEARSHLRWTSKALAGACLAALATPGGADMLYSVCRIVFISMLWAHHQWSTAALYGSAAGVAERFATMARAPGEFKWKNASGQDAKSRSSSASALTCLSRISSRDAALMRATLFAAHFGLGIMLLVFETVQHPRLEDQAGVISATSALIAERSSAITMVAVWIIGALAHACFMKSEACIWVSPRAAVLLDGTLETHDGCLSPSAGLELAEALSGASGDKFYDALLHEFLNVFGVAVLCGPAVLCPADAEPTEEKEPQPQPLALPQLTHQDLSDLRAELIGGVKQTLDPCETRIMDFIKSVQESLTKNHDSLARALRWKHEQEAAATASTKLRVMDSEVVDEVPFRPAPRPRHSMEGSAARRTSAPPEDPTFDATRSRPNTASSSLRRASSSRVSDDTTLDALYRQSTRDEEWERPPQPSTRSAAAAASAVDKPRRISRTPPRRISERPRSEAVPGAGVAAWALDSDDLVDSSSNNSADNLLEFGIASTSRANLPKNSEASSTSAKTPPPPTVRAAPPPSRPPSSVQNRPGRASRLDRPSKPQRSALEPDRRPSRLPDADPDDNPSWSTVNVF